MAAPGMLSVDTSQYDLARKRAAQENQAQVQAQKDALQRRAAQTGGGVSGALIKQEQLAHETGAKRLADVNEGLNAQVAQERQRVGEINTGRQFQTSERESGQKFASGETALQRRFMTGEREAGQKFVSGESALQRGFLTGEREAGQQFASGERKAGQTFAAAQAAEQRNWQDGVNNADRRLRLKAMDIQESQFAKQLQFSMDQFGWEQQVDQWNKDLSNRVQYHNETDSGFEQIFNFKTWKTKPKIGEAY